MKRLTPVVALFVAWSCLATQATLYGQSTVTSTASAYGPGSTAVSNVHGEGNVQLFGNATADLGGTATSNLQGAGLYGGYAGGRSNAISSGGGIAVSNARTTAFGTGAVSIGQSDAAARFGTAVSNLDAQSHGQALTIATGQALSNPGGFASSNNRALGIGLSGGRADVRTNSTAYSYGPPSTTGVSGTGIGTYAGTARVQADGVSIGQIASPCVSVPECGSPSVYVLPYLPATVNVSARAEGINGGNAESTASHFNYGSGFPQQ